MKSEEVKSKNPRSIERGFLVRVARLARVLRTPARTRSEKLSPGDFLCCFHSTDLFKSLSLLCNKKNQQNDKSHFADFGPSGET